jgi:Protein of unknown function (DUF2752)
VAAHASRWRIRLVLVLIVAVGLPVVVAVLDRYPPGAPGAGSIYPPCVFHALTGLHCPGCGATRCTYALVHGDLPQALAYNPLLVVALPFLAASLAASAYRLWTGRPPWRRRLPGWSIYLIFAVVFTYWVLRNVDVYPLTLLAPHRL